MTKAELTAKAAQWGIEFEGSTTNAEMETAIVTALSGMVTDLGHAIPADPTIAALEELINAERGQPEATVTVVGPKEGRRRIGHRFTREPKIFRRSDLTDDQMRDLRADPLLAVSETL